MTDKIIGIDLGTTNSVVAHMDSENGPEIIEIDGKRKIKSVVSYIDKDNPVVGEEANNYSVQNPNKTIKSIKRKMGTDYTLTINGEEYTPVDISADILKYIKQNAEEQLGEKINDAVITVPAYFNDKQRNATKDAGEIAGFNVHRIINEPTAASMSYGLITKERDENILVYDLGGGTFDVTVLDITYGMYEIKSTAGNNKLGGDDWTKRICNHIIDKFQDMYNIDHIHSKPHLYQKILEQSEIAKKRLMDYEDYTIIIPIQNTSLELQEDKLEYNLSRKEFQDITEDLINKTIDPLDSAIMDAGLEYDDIDTILLTGGSIRMHQVKDIIKDKFGKIPLDTIDPDESVALGAAIQGAVLDNKEYPNSMVQDIVLLDVVSLSLGVEIQGGLFEPIIDKNTTIPVKKRKVFTTSKDAQTKVDIKVYQGEREIADENVFLDSFSLTNIPIMRAGVPEIEVTFKVNEDGILEVSAYEKSQNNEKKITIEGGVGLSDDEIETKKKEAEKYENIDKEKRKEITLSNKAQSDIRNSKIVRDRYDLTNEMSKRINNLMSDIEEEIERDNIDTEKLSSKLSDLDLLINEIRNKCDRIR